MHIDTDVNGNCRLLLCYCTSNWAGDNERWCVLRTFIAFQKMKKNTTGVDIIVVRHSVTFFKT